MAGRVTRPDQEPAAIMEAWIIGFMSKEHDLFYEIFRKAAAYSELGKSLSALILQLEQTRRKVNLSLDSPHELKFEISMWAYLYEKRSLT